MLLCLEEGSRHGGLAGVVGEMSRLSVTTSRRLQLAAEASGVTALAIRRWRNAAAAADFGQPTAAATRCLIAFHGVGQCCFKGGERNYSPDAPSRREDRYCVGDIPKEALNNRLKWADH